MTVATDRRERIGWYVYDWANSAFSTTVVTVFLGPYLTTITRAAADAGGFVYPLGIPIQAGAFFPFMVSLAVLLQVICLPLLGAIADYSRRKKQLLALCAYLGAAATMALVLVQGTNYLLGGALGFNRVAGVLGAKRTVVLTLLVWTGALAYVYAFLRTTLDFYLLGVVIALVLGGSQALSRSLYSLMIPPGQESEYFSLYEISDKGTSWLGPLLYGLALQFSGSYRLALLSIVVFFVFGIILLLRVDVRRAAVEAGNRPPARV